jgi:type IV secretory pathway TrbD component
MPEEEEEQDMNYDVVAGTLPTMTLTIKMTWLGAALGLIVLVGFAMLAWNASADWRASITPVWCRTRWQEFLGVNDAKQFKAKTQ